jgi:hypothetical protein
MRLINKAIGIVLLLSAACFIAIYIWDSVGSYDDYITLTFAVSILIMFVISILSFKSADNAWVLVLNILVLILVLLFAYQIYDLFHLRPTPLIVD